MPKFSFNLDNVESVVSKKSYKFDDVKGDFTKIAFDIYHKNDAPADELWQIQNSDDGDYIVALYNDEEKISTASSKPWAVMVKNADLHFFYKQEHLCKIAASKLGFDESDLSLAKRYLPEKLSTNKALVSALLRSVDQDTLTDILSKYPELA